MLYLDFYSTCTLLITRIKCRIKNIAQHCTRVLPPDVPHATTVSACYALCLMYNAASQLLGIWCIDLYVDLIALLTMF